MVIASACRGRRAALCVGDHSSGWRAARSANLARLLVASAPGLRRRHPVAGELCGTYRNLAEYRICLERRQAITKTDGDNRVAATTADLLLKPETVR